MSPTERINADGFRWIQREGTDDALAYGAHEPEVTRILSDLKGDTFLDIGAHVGRYSVRCARNFKTVWAWEPGYNQRGGLSKNLQLNEITNVIIVPFAAWKEDTVVQYDKTEHNGRANVLGEGVPIPARRVDSLVTHADVIKVDVEGAEAEVLEGLGDLLYWNPTLYVEIHDWLDPTLGDKCREVLRPYGYSIREFEVHGETYWECY